MANAIEKFSEQIRRAVNEFITHEEDYSDDVQLQIDPTDLSVCIADPEQDLPTMDYYPIMDLVSAAADDSGRWVADEDAIAEVAAEYIGVE